MSREISGLHEAAYILATFAILSQILALFRDKLFALFFGAGDMLDVYYSAFRIPDLLFVSIGSIVSASILLPYLMSHFEKGKEDGNRFADQIFTVFFSLIIVFGIVVFFFAPRLVEWLLPGFRYDPHLNDLITMTRIMLLSPVLLGLSNLYSSLTQMNHRFLLYALSPILYNISIILGVVILYPIMGITGLAIGVVIGAFLHLFVQVPYMKREGLVPSFTLSIEWKKIGRIFANALPRMVTLSSSQLATFFLVSLASLMAVGSISVFTLAFNLQSVPLTIIGASYTSAVFPSLSRLIVQGKRQEFLEKIIASAQHIIFWSVPLMILFVVLRAQIVRVIYGAGAFDWNDTKLTAAVLALFVISTVAQSLILLFVRSYYAEGKTAQPLLISIISGALIAIFGYLFVKIFFLFPMFKFFVESLLQKKLAEAQALLDQQPTLSSQTFSMVPVRPVGLSRFLIIDKGSNDGLQVGQTVIYKDNYIGQLKEVSPHKSVVSLSTDPDSKLAAFVINQQGRSQGILLGQFGSEMLLDKVIHEEPMEKNDLVYTSGSEDNIPRGLIVGRVEETLVKDGEVFKQAKVKPIFNLANLDLLFVITN
jgi:putative peptidoglycan lipid II flippase